jgi:CheY-like chemotaxis protein
MDGRTLARAVRGRHPHLPIIGMTGLADGVDGLAQPVPELTVLLTKPFNNVLLLDTLHHLLPAPTATT